MTLPYHQPSKFTHITSRPRGSGKLEPRSESPSFSTVKTIKLGSSSILAGYCESFAVCPKPGGQFQLDQCPLTGCRKRRVVQKEQLSQSGLNRSCRRHTVLTKQISSSAAHVEAGACIGQQMGQTKPMNSCGRCIFHSCMYNSS